MGITVYYDLDFLESGKRTFLGLYKLTSTSQKKNLLLLQRSAGLVISIPSNLSESCGRNTLKETLWNRLILINDLTYTNYDIKSISGKNHILQKI